MAFSTISIELDVCGEEELFEVDITWSLDSTNGDLLIEDFHPHYVSYDGHILEELLICPDWFKGIIDRSKVLYEYEDLIIDNGEGS
jgi:hypothetical protein